MFFTNEQEFEKAIVNSLQEYGWKGFVGSENLSKNYDIVLNNVTETQLIQNWKNILFENNKDILNGIALSDEEMEQVLNEVKKCNTFVDSNVLITGEFIGITRTNELDQDKIGKQVQLRIFYRRDIKAGNNIYQIARQVSTNTIDGEKRADLMLLFNGMPLIHIELKNTNTDLQKAIIQIQNYSRLGFYKGIFKLVQVIVAMKPNEMVYMPNVNSYQDIVEDKFLKWTDSNNNLVSQWQELIKQFLSIPAAHRMVSDYTIADSSDNNLKILRSYQVHAVNKIQDKFFKSEFFKEKSKKSVKGGHIWHSTGSGKTLTSFKLATLLLEWDQADIVLFVVDRIELGIQTKNAFKYFNSSSRIDVCEVTSTNDLVKQLISDSIKQKLIITSIHKQSRVKEENYENALNKISKKRIVFIFDEAHRTTFGEMYKNITENIPNSVMFGFTGTPIRKENAKNYLTTQENFGELLHKYTMKEAINDRKVLSFNCEYRYIEKVLLPFIDELKHYNVKENFYSEKALNDLEKIKNSFHDKNKHILRFEKELFTLISNQKQQQIKQEIVNDILNRWNNKSSNKKFSAILATSSIKDAIEYFDVFDKEIKNRNFNLKFSALFDPSIDITEESTDVSKGLAKSEAVKKIITKYNKDFNTNFNIENPKDHISFKEDLQRRLAQKEPYINIDNEKKLDLLIVVNQLLTGYDSKYINTVYFDKTLEYEHLIQAISRTNRTVKSSNKPYGNVIFYRQPSLMRWNMDEALELYAGVDPAMAEPKNLDVFCSRIDKAFNEIKEIFKFWNYPEFEAVPDQENISEDDAKRLLQHYQELRKNLNSAMILDFNWEDEPRKISMSRDEFQLINIRIKEIDFTKFDSLSPKPGGEIDIIIQLANVDNSSWFIYVDDKYIRSLIIEIRNINNTLKNKKNDQEITVLKTRNDELKKKLLKEIYKFPKQYQHFAEEGVRSIISSMNIRDINEFSLWQYVRRQVNKENEKQIKDFAEKMNLDITELKKIINSDDIINANGRLDNLCKDKLTNEVKTFLSTEFNITLFKVKQINYINYVKEFIISQRKKAKIFI
ncbi:HsdR family type I site-specific deoxyribonuclease [Mycoplasma leachii]|uniref:Type I restriction enzyme endonuclease subunit n=1 Tax=Mycoplasma leachii 06049 TaxID=1188244 RepID=A0A2T4I904_9MOLU|nr:HsdR family type I site-specific deoxyribonuclease [Mycoplasma leachii]PTD30985.1 Type I restriction modification system endonuclease (R) subunit, HsdR [Mycoplasma leachii 06049]